jgi:hypothetical protein
MYVMHALHMLTRSSNFQPPLNGCKAQTAYLKSKILLQTWLTMKARAMHAKNDLLISNLPMILRRKIRMSFCCIVQYERFFLQLILWLRDKMGPEWNCFKIDWLIIWICWGLRVSQDTFTIVIPRPVSPTFKFPLGAASPWIELRWEIAFAPLAL